MAYAEKRGKGLRPWRVKYKAPDGSEVSESGFETKTSALIWGRDQEARIREGRWFNPAGGRTTVGEWMDRWVELQDVGISTQANREYQIRRFLRPAWGNSPLNTITTERIILWEKGLPDQMGISRRTARDVRSLLGTILGDAASTRPPLIAYNPAVRPRNRGRRTGRRLERSPRRAWATPLQALLVGERAALLSGRDEEFTMVILIGYTGLRWGEATGLEREFVKPGEIHIEWQLRELGGRFHRLPPKDDSYRSTAWEPGVPVDLPPFLDDLLAYQMKEHPYAKCACASVHAGSGFYVFRTPDSRHYRRSNYGRRIWRPACEGRVRHTSKEPERLVITDATTWPGVPLTTWPLIPSGQQNYQPPTGRGRQHIPDGTPLATWLAVAPGLTPHGLRHGHKTWMAEDGIPEILSEQRLGHDVPGMRGLYAHASDPMRARLKEALQKRWEDSLRARAAIHPHSPVPLLDALLAPFRTTGQADGTASVATVHQLPTQGDRGQSASQTPPKHESGPIPHVG